MPYTALQEATEGLFERRDQLAERNANLVRRSAGCICHGAAPTGCSRDSMLRTCGTLLRLLTCDWSAAWEAAAANAICPVQWALVARL